MVFLILESHRALHFRCSVNEHAQRIARQRVIIPARVDVLELAGFVIGALGIRSLKQKAFNLIRCIERVAFFLVQDVGIVFQHAANVGRVRRSALVDDLTKHQDLARAEYIRGRPVERRPVDTQPQIALPLRGEPTNRRAVEREIVPALDQKLLVVVQHVQPAFKIAEHHGHGLDPLFVGQVLQPLLLDLANWHAGPALLLRFQIQVFQFVVAECQEITQFVGHGCPSVSYSFQQE